MVCLENATMGLVVQDSTHVIFYYYDDPVFVTAMSRAFLLVYG
jgi:hypothetical protein